MATAAEQQRQPDPQQQQPDPQLEAEWDEKTRPSRDAPRVNSLYLRKDYAAACPEQHLAYLRCLKEARGWLPTTVHACHDEYKAFAICKHRAKEANKIPGLQPEGERPSMAARLWQDLQREPVYIALRLSVQDALGRLGLGGSGDGGSSSSSDGSSSNGSGSSSSDAGS